MWHKLNSQLVAKDFSCHHLAVTRVLFVHCTVHACTAGDSDYETDFVLLGWLRELNRTLLIFSI